MYSNYFSIAIRNLRINKGYSLINIGGLAIGMASAILILMWVMDEVRFDRFHAHADRIYQVWSNDTIVGKIRSISATPEVMAPTLKTDYPEIEEVTRTRWTRNLLGIPGQSNNLLSSGAVVDAGFLSIFSFPLLKGDVRLVLKDPNSIVLTAALATKLFNNTDPVGKIVTMGGKINYTVSGILKDIPSNSQFSYIQYLTSYQREMIDRDWSNFSISTFILLKPKADADLLNTKLKTIITQHTTETQTTEFLYPFSQTHLYDNFENGIATGGHITTVRTFFLIALFILLIACINFMNLATARSGKRAKEIGVRKAIGAQKHTIILQFLIESVILSAIAGFVAYILVAFSLPFFNQLTGKQLQIEYNNPYYWMAAVGFILLTGILAGSYPAFFLSGFKPVAGLKGLKRTGPSMVNPRKVLVVLQFTFAVTLIICTIIISQQIKHGQQRKTGLNMQQLVNVSMNDEMASHYSLIKQALITAGYATSVSKVQSPLSENWGYGLSLRWQGRPEGLRAQVNRYSTDGSLITTAGMHLLAGRDIDVNKYPTDSSACIINEAAVKLMGFKSPLGQEIYDDPDSWHVVGVIEDFIQESPYMPVKPIVIKGPKSWMSTMLICLNPDKPVAANVAGMEKIFREYNPAYPFEYQFADDAYNMKFGNEQLTGKLTGLFAGLTIFISCLGLFGLAAFMAESRFREIGIRKVLGASTANITVLLSKEFVQLVIIAVLIASPVAYLISHRWLQDFYYRIQINSWTFVAAGAVAIMIALLTVSSQAIKAALTNPVKSLKSE
ncbi:ABC transporter permease [Chitinophaga sp. Cy-1792]|uniref:ABC transporter permease n=1 Tax=Chitinophaga sp. Cy-1792 TaxID=2608339 RepID=UPI00141DA037|nr:ABC transporter permease [Chitinophaga sp. Cy-1792]NIG54081.1 FtsX-like permease family protein [Chitinophaga sp. Cy-1792]